MTFNPNFRVFATDEPPAGGASTPPPTDPPAVPPVVPPTAAPTAEDLARWQKEAKDHAKEAQNLRERLKAIADAEEAKRVEGLSEIEKLKHELAESKKESEQSKKAEKEAKRQALESTIKSGAVQLGFANPEDALAFIDLKAVEGDGSNVNDLLNQLLVKRPYLKGSTIGAPPNPGSGVPGGNLNGVEKQAAETRARELFPAIGKLQPRQ